MTDVADAQLQMHREGMSLERLAKIDRATQDRQNIRDNCQRPKIAP